MLGGDWQNAKDDFTNRVFERGQGHAGVVIAGQST